MLVTRGNRAFEYRSRRVGGRVRVEYVRGQSIPAEAAELRRLDEIDRREDRSRALAAWSIEQERCLQAERELIEIDRAFNFLAEVALLATGHRRQNRGRWRKRRGKMNVSQGVAIRPGGTAMDRLLDEYDQAGESDLDGREMLEDEIRHDAGVFLKRARTGDESALPELRALLARRPDCLGPIGIGSFAAKAVALTAGDRNDVFLRDVFVREIAATRDELAGPDPSPLERLLCERVALAWFAANQGDIAAIEASLNGLATEKVDHLEKQRSRANARFLSSAKALAIVRKLAMPVLKISLTERTTTTTHLAGNPASIESSSNQTEVSTDEKN